MFALYVKTLKGFGFYIFIFKYFTFLKKKKKKINAKRTSDFRIIHPPEFYYIFLASQTFEILD